MDRFINLLYIFFWTIAFLVFAILSYKIYTIKENSLYISAFAILISAFLWLVAGNCFSQSLFESSINKPDEEKNLNIDFNGYGRGSAYGGSKFYDYSSVFAVGTAMPGLVDSINGINYTIKKEAYRNFVERFSMKFGKMVYINNNARK